MGESYRVAKLSCWPGSGRFAGLRGGAVRRFGFTENGGSQKESYEAENNQRDQSNHEDWHRGVPLTIFSVAATEITVMIVTIARDVRYSHSRKERQVIVRQNLGMRGKLVN